MLCWCKSSRKMETMTMKITYAEAGALLKTHPRTVIRAVHDKVNFHLPYTTEVDHAKVAEAFGFDPVYLVRARDDRDEFLTAQQAADFLKLKLATFRYRKPPKIVERGGVVRFSRRDIVRWDLS